MRHFEMSVLLAMQLVLFAAAATIVGWRSLRMFGWASLDARAFVPALEAELRQGRAAHALELTRALRPASAAVLASALLVEREQGGDVRAALEEALADARQALQRGRGAILSLGRMASPLALIAVIFELAPTTQWVNAADGLQRQALWAAALQRSAFSFALGLATLALCIAALLLLRRRAAAIGRDLDRVATLFEGLPAAANEEAM